MQGNEQAIRPTMQAIAGEADMEAMNEAANGFIRAFPPERGISIATAMSYANPFFLPAIPDALVGRVAIPIETYGEVVLRAKLTAARAQNRNILVAGAPGSAGPALQAALAKALLLPEATLSAAVMDADSAVRLGGALREQEIDELSLIRNGLNGAGYVAGQPVRANPYSLQLLSLYGVDAIVTFRSLFDTIIALDEAVMARRALPESAFGRYFDDGMPKNFHRLDAEARHVMLARRHVTWLVNFYISWKKCARAGLARPLFLSHEADVLGDRALLAARIADHLGLGIEEETRLAVVLIGRESAAALHADRPGRGAGLCEAAVEEVMRVVSLYSTEEDLTPLLPQ
jgi:hypothetical protein